MDRPTSPQDSIPLESQSAEDSRNPAHEHLARFYDRDYGAEKVAEFLGEGLATGGAALVIAPEDHCRAIHEALRQAMPRDARDPAADGRLVFLEARQTLDRLLGEGGLGNGTLPLHLGPVVGPLVERYGRLHAYGEMVDLLAKEGRMDDAVALEAAWNEFLSGNTVHLLCGYDIGAFDGEDASDSFRRVCEEHAQVIPMDSRDSEASVLSHDRLVSELEHKTRLARWSDERLVRLQRVTAALSEAATSEDVGRLVGGAIRRLLGAESAFLAVPGSAEGELRFVGDPPAQGDTSEGIVSISLLAESLESGEPGWHGGLPNDGVDPSFGPRHPAVACLPLLLRGRALGAVAFVFEPRRRFPSADRALLGAVVRQIAVALDRAGLYEEAARTRAEAERANRAKDDFLAMLGHELRNPLAPMVTTLHLMKLRGGGHLEQERSVIERQVAHLVKLVDDLLDVSRVTRGKIELDRKRVELAEIVAQAIETTGPLIEERGHRLHLDVPSTGLAVEGDVSRLVQVVANLLDNAAKYTSAGGNLEVRAEADEGHVVLSVRDDGVGISSDLLPTLFEAFVQGPRGQSRSEGGLGLGLSIVHKIVELHGGSVVASSPGTGRGSEFAVRLPRVPCLVHAEPVSESPVVPLDPRGLRALVVDDNVDAARALSELLREMGCRTGVAHDGREALAAARDLDPRLILLDIGLPGMDGYEVIQGLRELPGMGRGGARIVAVTGYGQPTDRERTERAGFDAHYVKPLDAGQLRSLIDGIDSEEIGSASA